MADTLFQHILYEWEPTVEVEIMGKSYTYSQGLHSLILHRLDALAHFPQIPVDAKQTPVRWCSYTEKWFDANGRELLIGRSARA